MASLRSSPIIMKWVSNKDLSKDLTINPRSPCRGKWVLFLNESCFSPSAQTTICTSTGLPTSNETKHTWLASGQSRPEWPKVEEMDQNQNTAVSTQIWPPGEHKPLKRTQLRPNWTGKRKERKGEYQKEVLPLATTSLVPGNSDFWGQAPGEKCSKQHSGFTWSCLCPYTFLILWNSLKDECLRGQTSVS